MNCELLAPAGNLKKLKVAIRYGADAVYLGGKAFSLRAFSDNFTEEELQEGIAYAHERGKKVYVCANIFAKNEHNSRMIMQVELEKITDYAQGINVYKDGEVTAYKVGETRFNEICAEWNSMLYGAHQMPAFGVSLHRETVKALKSGVWAEFTFDGEMSSNGKT